MSVNWHANRGSYDEITITTVQSYITKYVLNILRYCFILWCYYNIDTINLLIFFLFRKFDKFTAELHPIPVKDDVWHTIGVDLIGPLPETPRGNKFIMTATCLFSKWPEVAALPDKSATGIAEVLFKCFTRHGCCRVKITDQESLSTRWAYARTFVMHYYVICSYSFHDIP